MLTTLRSALFWTGFVAMSALFSLGGAALAPIHAPWGTACVRGWSRTHRWLCRWVLGQRVRVIGALADRPCLYVFKHESAFETIDQPLLFRRPGVFAKAELLDIPVWGGVARAYGLIPVERDSGPRAMRAMLAAARAMIADGRPLVLFAEGTRVAPGAAPPLQAGFAGIYRMLGVEVVPVAVRSGHVYPARNWLKWPGEITYHIGDPIPPGLPRAEAEARTHAAINALNQSEQSHPARSAPPA